jgi:hypothetical protein
MPVFVKIRCPNEQCTHIVGGPSVDTLLEHDFDLGPFEDLRYCGGCNTMFLVKMDGLEHPVRIVAAEKGEKFSMVDPTDVFDFVTISRRSR